MSPRHFGRAVFPPGGRRDSPLLIGQPSSVVGVYDKPARSFTRTLARVFSGKAAHRGVHSCAVSAVGVGHPGGLRAVSRGAPGGRQDFSGTLHRGRSQQKVRAAVKGGVVARKEAAALFWWPFLVWWCGTRKKVRGVSSFSAPVVRCTAETAERTSLASLPLPPPSLSLV